ncbi:MAG: diacylglycerol kinase [Minisyncoccia bacterium]
MKNFKNKNIIESFQRAFEGIIYIYKTHNHFKIEILIGLLAILTGLILHITKIEWLFLFTAIFLFFISEIFNTIIEEMGDKINRNFDPEIKVIKDLSGGAVLFAVIFSLIIGALIFLPKIFKFFK